MAKVVMPLLSGQASGQFAGAMVFQKNGVVREYVIPDNPNSELQQAVRNRLGDIQRCLKTLGAELRVDLPAHLGSHWNALMISDILNNDAAYWIAKKAIYDAFQSGEKTAWAAADPGLGYVNDDGFLLYVCAVELYDITLRIWGTADIVLPVHDNAATIGAAWIAAA